MTAADTPARGRRRAPILILVVVALAAGALAGHAHLQGSSRAPSPVYAAEGSSRHAISTAWYCPGLPASFPTGAQTVTLSNLGATDADAVVTIHPDDGSATISRTVSVPHDTVRTFDRGSLLSVSVPKVSGKNAPKPLPAGPIVVEPFSPDVVVSAGLESDTALSVVPCATTASTEWQFAAGTTVRGVSQWLVLDDPFSSDARVDVTLRTDSGLLLLPALQGIDVPGRSRVVIPIHDQAVRQARVAVEVHATVGQVVAAQTIDFGSESGRPGVATALGALGASSRWSFVDGQAVANSQQWVALTDLSQIDANVDVQGLTASKAIVQPVVLTVPSGTVSWVQIGGCGRTAKNCLAVPTGSGFELTVQSDAKVQIVAQTLSRFSKPKTALGATTSMGSTTAARQWVIARTRALDEQSTSISLVNPGVPAAHVDVEVVYDGVVERPASLQHLTIPSLARVVLPAGAAGVARHDDAAVVVRSDEPIFAESTIYAKRDATRAPGIPSR